MTAMIIKPNIVVTRPDKEPLDEMTEQLCRRHDKPELQKMAAPFYKIMTENQVTVNNPDGRPGQSPIKNAGRFNKPVLITAMSKRALAELISIFRLKPENMDQQTVVSGVDSRDPMTILKVKAAREGLVGSSTIQKIMGADAIRVDEDRRYRRIVLAEGLRDWELFYDPSRTSMYSDDENLLYLGLPEKKILDIAPMAFPLASGPLRTSDTLTGELANAETFTGEPSIVQVLTTIRALFDAGQIETGKSKLMTDVKLKVAVGAMPVFQPQVWADDPSLSQWCRRMCALVIAGWRMRGIKPEMLSHDGQMLFDIFGKLPLVVRTNPQIVMAMLPHVEGLTNTMVDNGYFGSLVRTAIGQLANLGRDQWIGTAQYLDRVSVVAKYEMRALTDVSSRNSYKMVRGLGTVYYTLLTNQYTGKKILPDMLVDNVGRPFVEAFIMLLAAMGYVEVALSLKADAYGQTSPMDVVKAFRLTPLGLYACGITKDVKLTRPDTSSQFEVDQEHTMILLHDKPSPYRNWIQSISRDIGGGRRLVTEQTILSQCRKPENIEDIYDYFVEHICQQPPKVWQDLFDTLVAKTKAVKNSTKSYQVYELDPSDAALHRLVLSDKNLRPYIRQAQQYTILVETAHNTEFLRLLASAGYLM